MDIDKKRYLRLSTRDRASRIEGLTGSFVEGTRGYAVARFPYSIRTVADIVRADNEMARMAKELNDELDSFIEEIKELRKLTLHDKLTHEALIQIVRNETWKPVFKGPTPNTFFSGNCIITIDDEHVSIGGNGDPVIEFTLSEKELQELHKALTREPGKQNAN